MATRCVLLLAWAAAWAFPQLRLQPPRLGVVQDPEGRLLSVYGLSGNVFLGEPLLTGVVTAASSSRWTMAKLETELVLLDEHGAVRARWVAPRGPARFAFTGAGEPALAYFAETGELCRVGPQALRVTATLDEEPLAVAWRDPEHGLVIVRRPEGLWARTISLRTGQSLQESFLAESAEAALVASGGCLIHGRGSELCFRLPNAAPRCVDLPAPLEALAQIADQWVEVRLAGKAGRRLLRLDPETEVLYRLPEVER